MSDRTKNCDLCGDAGPMHVHARCHPTAPLRAVLDAGVLTLRCYVPECDREVGRFVVAGPREGSLQRLLDVAKATDHAISSLLAVRVGLTDALLRDLQAEIRGAIAQTEGRASAPSEPPPRDWSKVCIGMGGVAVGPPCCDRHGEYNGYRSSTRLFECPRSCPCHD